MTENEAYAQAFEHGRAVGDAEGYARGVKEATKHGRWIGCRCSLCDRSALEDEDIDTGEYDVNLSAYCPHCGAMMVGGIR